MLNRDALDYLRSLPISAHALLPFEEPSTRDQALVEYIRGATTQNRMILHLSADLDRDSRLLFGGSAKESVRDQIRILRVREVFTWPLSIERSIAFLKTASADANSSTNVSKAARGSSRRIILAQTPIPSRSGFHDCDPKVPFILTES